MLIEKASPFDTPGIQFFACEYNVNKIDLSHSLFSEIAIPPCLNNAVLKRKVEYLVGRYCSQQALNAMGVFAAVTRSLDRSPKWPPTICGSITHCHQYQKPHCEAYSMAAVGSKDQWTAIGIDTEIISTQTQITEFAHQFMHAHELKVGMERGFKEGVWLFTVFSAKESVFKSLYPAVNAFFDFQDVTVIAVNPQNDLEGFLTLRLVKSLNPYPQGFIIQCAYVFEKNYVHTLIAF